MPNRPTALLRLFVARLLLVGVSLFLASAASAQQPVAEIPYRLAYGGWITIKVNVNGSGPYDFIIDSGATVTVAFQNLADEQPITPADGHAPIRIFGLVNSQFLQAMRIGDIDIGGQHMNDHIGVIIPDWSRPKRSPKGVVGLDFLTRYDVLIDATDKVIRLYDRDAPPRALMRAWTSTPLVADTLGASERNLYRAKVFFEGKPIPCLVDLGASGTIVNYRALERILSRSYSVIQNGSSLRFSTRVSDIFDNTEVARVMRMNVIRMGGAKWRGQDAIIYDAPIFKELGVNDRSFCLVGVDLMAQRSFMFDFADEKLFVGPKAGAAD